MRAQALFSVLSRKLKDNEIFFIDSLEMPKINTKAGIVVVQNLVKAGNLKNLKTKKSKILMALYERNKNAEKSFRNIPILDIVFLKNLNPLGALNHQYLLIENPVESVKFLESRG